MSEGYGYSVEVGEGYDEAIVRTRLALRAEGFSIVTEMHVGGLLGPEAGSERQYLIMGAWAAPVAERDVATEMRVAVHLPCNVVVHETGDSALVAALDPEDALEEADGSAAVAARAALERVLERVMQG